MTLSPARLYLNIAGAALLIGALVWGILYIKGLRDDLATAQDKVQKQGQVLEATAGAVELLKPTLAERATAQSAIRDRRATVESQVQELRNEDSSVDAYLSSRIPQRLRDLDRTTDGPASPPPGRDGVEPGY